MNIAHPIPSTVTSISFSFLTSQDIRRISVKQIVNPVLLDDLNRPNIGGLYDPALGPSDPKDMFVRTYVVTSNSDFGIAAQHVDLTISPVLVTLAILNFRRLCSIHSL